MIRIVAAVFVALIVVLAGTAWFLLATTAGASWLVGIGQEQVPGELEIAGVGGSIARGVVARRVVYSNEDLTIILGDVRLDVALGELPSGVVDVRSLEAASVRLNDLPLELQVYVVGTIGLSADVPVDAKVEWMQTGGPASGSGRFAGPLDLLAFTHMIELPDIVKIDGTVENTLDAPSVSAVATWAQLTLPEQDFGALVSRDGTVTVDGSTADYRVSATAEFIRDGTQQLSVDVAAHGNSEQLTIDRLELAGLGGELSARGTVGFAEPAVATLAVSGRDFDPGVLFPGYAGRLSFDADVDARWPERLELRLERLDGEFLGAPISGNATVAIDGSTADYRVSATAELIRDGTQQLSVDVAAHGNSEQLTIDRLELTELGGELSARGTVGFAEPAVVTLAVSGKDFDPGVLFPGYAGRLSFDADVDARWPERLELRMERLGGEFLGAPISGNGELLAENGALRRADARLRSGANKLRLSVRGTERLAGEFEIDAPELDKLWPGLAGALTGTGTVTGSFDAPRLKVALTGDNLAFDEQRIGRLDVTGSVDEIVDIDARANKVTIGGQLVGDLRVLGTGTTDSHSLDFELSGGVVSTTFRTEGSWDGEALIETIDRAEVNTDVGVWTLSTAATLTAGPNGAGITAHCWDNAEARVCVEQFEIRDERVSVAAELERFPLQTLNPWLGDDLTLEGDADASLSIERDAERLNAELTWRQKDTRVLFQAGDDLRDEADVETRLSSVEITLVADDSTAQLTGSVIGEFGLTAAVELRTENPLADDGALAGTVRAQIPDIGELSPLIDRYVLAEKLVGALVVDIDIGGMRSAPALDGRAELTNASAFLPLFGIDVSDVNVTVSAGDNDTLIVDGSASSGDGRLDLSGTIGASADAGLYADVAVSGERFQLIRLPDQSVFISPDLTARFDAGEIRVDGKLLVPEAAFTFRELGDEAIGTSDDIVVHREDADPASVESRSRLTGQLDIELGDAVTFDGLDISTRLTGGILLTLRTNALPSGEGALQLADGTFNALGREMTIERGSLNFYGPLDDPVVDARASRRLTYEGQNIKIGIQLSGRLSEKLDFVLFSEPAMSENDILSYLVVGRPATTGDDPDGTVAGAAIALGLQSLSGPRRAGESLTLDEISFEGAGANDTAVVAGKRISDKWYLRYKYGLFNRVGTFIIRYEIGRGFSVEAGSGAQQSLDLIYSIDR